MVLPPIQLYGFPSSFSLDQVLSGAGAGGVKDPLLFTIDELIKPVH